MADLEINTISSRMDKLEASFQDFRKENKEDVNKILSKLDSLPDVYVTRREYEVAKEASKGNNSIWQMVISMAVSIGAFLIAMRKMK